MYSVFKSAPASLQAEYIVTRLQGEPYTPRTPGLITRALRYPICSETVLEAILRLSGIAEDVESTRVELPRRLFRLLAPRSARPCTTHDHPLPFLRYLFGHTRIPRPQPDSWEGYPLTKAVASKHLPLVRFLLEQGASPALKDGLAVQVAVRLKDLSLVKMLIEPGNALQSSSPSESSSDKRVEIRRRHTEENAAGGRGKKRKMEDRVEVSQAMLQTAIACNARDIVEYFMQEKSCMPDMQTIKLIGRKRNTGDSGSRRKRPKTRG